MHTHLKGVKKKHGIFKEIVLLIEGLEKRVREEVEENGTTSN